MKNLEIPVKEKVQYWIVLGKGMKISILHKCDSYPKAVRYCDFLNMGMENQHYIMMVTPMHTKYPWWVRTPEKARYPFSGGLKYWQKKYKKLLKEDRKKIMADIQKGKFQKGGQNSPLNEKLKPPLQEQNINKDKESDMTRDKLMNIQDGLSEMIRTVDDSKYPLGELESFSLLREKLEDIISTIRNILERRAWANEKE